MENQQTTQPQLDMIDAALEALRGAKKNLDSEMDKRIGHIRRYKKYLTDPVDTDGKCRRCVPLTPELQKLINDPLAGL